MRTFKIAALNIVMPAPHSPERYVELFQKTLRLRRAVKLRGDFVGMLGSLYLEEQIIVGYFYKFFDLNTKEGWFNLTSSQEAEPQELAQINVPAHLKPQWRR